MIALIILIALITMIITCIIVFRMQFRIKSSRIDLEYETLNELFKKRITILKSLLQYVSSLSQLTPDEQSLLAESKRLIGLLQESQSRDEAIENNVILTPVSIDLAELIKGKKEIAEKKDCALLLNELTCIQEDIQDAKQPYNTAVRLYNVSIQIVPAKFVAKFMHLHEIPMYNAAEFRG